MSLVICDWDIINQRPVDFVTTQDLGQQFWNLGWIAAAINSFSSILFCFVYFKICHIACTRGQPRNWLTITIYFEIILGLIIGCMAITSVILGSSVYETGKKSDVSTFSLVILWI